jgi:hypothetical protein
MTRVCNSALYEAGKHAGLDLGSPYDSGVVGRACPRPIVGNIPRAEKLIAAMSGAITIGMMMDHMVCSEIDAAIELVSKDIEMRRPNAPMIAFAEFLKPLRSSPHWPKLA